MSILVQNIILKVNFFANFQRKRLLKRMINEVEAPYKNQNPPRRKAVAGIGEKRFDGFPRETRGYHNQILNK